MHCGAQHSGRDSRRIKCMDFINPKSSRWKPHGDYNKKALWIKMEARKLTGQSSYGRGNIKTDALGYTWQFLAPKEFIESTVHEWVDYDSLLGRGAQVIAELEKGGREIGGALAAVGTGSQAAFNALKEKFVKGKLEIADLPAALQTLKTEAGKAALEIQVFNYRVDAPLHYKSSERRKFDFVFNLAEEGNPLNDIVIPVRTLQRLSAPVRTDDFYGILPPAVFDIYSYPDASFIRLKFAALKSVQPTWKGPYIDGSPTSCELTLSFEDMTPLFDSSFSQNPVKITQTGVMSMPDIKSLTEPYNQSISEIEKKLGPRMSGN